MKVADVGEFGLIRALAASIGVPYPPKGSTRPRPGFLVDLGDDAAVGRPRRGAPVWTTDTLVAGIHFFPERTPWDAVGWKSIAVNVSDIAAMGAEPAAALVTLALPPDIEVEDVESLYRGAALACSDAGCAIAGGDIVRSPVFSITVALAGWAFESELGPPIAMRRDAARPGDVVAVTGFLGDSAAGLALILEGAEDPDEQRMALIGRHERPSARLSLGHEAIAAGVRCAIDISDGLLQDLGHVARASGAGIRVDIARLPMSEALTAVFPGRAAGMALSGGEDYELALIGSPAVIERLLRAGQVPITEIGEVTAARPGEAWAVDESGRELPVHAGGWDHFRTEPSP